MKRIVILFLVLLLMSGCTNIQNSSLDALLDETANSELEIYNTYRKGYKFYLPNHMHVKNSREFNEVIRNKYDTFYMYIDLISYLSSTSLEYKNEGESYYFRYLNKDDKNGYIVIKVTQDAKYLVEIAYNYAKIEVIVEEARLKSTVSEAMTILASIEYNDSFLKSISEESLLSYKEEAVDIFKKGDSTESNKVLQYIDEFEGVEENTVPDWDLVR